MKATTRPEGMVCSAKATPPIPPPSIRAPTRRALRHSRNVGSDAPRASCHASNSPPAATKRVAIRKYGAKPTNAKRMTR
jgi:hypothetical protein